MTVKLVTISDSEKAVSIVGEVGSIVGNGIFCSSLDGWYSNPELKVTQTEKQTGNGAFSVQDQDVIYAARTVTVGVTIVGNGRSEVQSLMHEILSFASENVIVSVKDENLETYSIGYLKASFDTRLNDSGATGTITVICPDPRRLSVNKDEMFLTPHATQSGGVEFDVSKSYIKLDPVSFSGETVSPNKGTVNNNGTSTAYPIITASGNMSGLSITDASSGRQLVYGNVITYEPLIIDCYSRTANVGGIDVTRYLTSRHFPKIEPGGSLTLTAIADGSGAVSVLTRDTYL